MYGGTVVLYVEVKITADTHLAYLQAAERIEQKVWTAVQVTRIGTISERLAKVHASSVERISG